MSFPPSAEMGTAVETVERACEDGGRGEERVATTEPAPSEQGGSQGHEPRARCGALVSQADEHLARDELEGTANELQSGEPSSEASEPSRAEEPQIGQSEAVEPPVAGEPQVECAGSVVSFTGRGRGGPSSGKGTRGRGGGRSRGQTMSPALVATLLASSMYVGTHAVSQVVPPTGVSMEGHAGDQPAAPHVARGLCMGSSDPHMLGGATAQWAPRRAAFSVLAHSPADAAEVASRAFPQMNEPPKTDSIEPPEPIDMEPPRVTCRTQVVPRETLRLVGNWRRRVRRSMAFAARGSYSMARRMRPPDLWLPTERHQTAATRPWVWDFTPLDRGEPALPMPISGRAGVEPDTDLVLPELREQQRLRDFGDYAIVDEMVTGLLDDIVELPHQRGTLSCAPHLSALKHWAVASERTARNVERKWAYEGELPCWPLRACPYGVVDESQRAGEPKWRLTNDLSWPPPGSLPAEGGEFVCAHNDAMERSWWPQNRMLHVKDVAESAAIMQTAGAPVKLFSVDCEAFYRKMGRQTSQWWRNAMAVPAGFQIDKRCCFGSAADAAKCARISNFLAAEARKAFRDIDQQYPTRDANIVAWQEARRVARAGSPDAATCDDLTVVGFYIDDAPACSFDDPLFDRDGGALWRDGKHVTRAELKFEALRAVLKRFGHESKPSKEQPPRMRLEVLGVTVDLRLARMWLSPGKAEAYAKRVDEALELRSMDRIEYLRLLGRLQFAAALYPMGRQWLHAAWRVARVRFRLSGDRVQLTPRVRADLRRWERELRNEQHEGVPLACRLEAAAMGQPGAGAMYADASGGWGWAAWTVIGEKLVWCGGEWSRLVAESLHINEKELYASTAGLLTLAPLAGWTSVHNFTDSTVAMGAMRSFTASSPRMQELLATRATWLLEAGVAEAVYRVTSAQNLWADLASRGKSAEMERQAAALGLTCERVPVVRQLSSIDHLAAMDGDTH